MDRTARNNQYDEIHAEAAKIGADALHTAARNLCRIDLFYLMTRILNRLDMDRDWLYERCVEIQQNPDGFLDLWAREHYKSTIITFGKTIQDILKNPEITVGIFSHTKPIARAFLRQIKYELETNERLKSLFPDILYQEPKRESSRWSEDKGITVKRKTNPKEATVEAHGLVDGQPTSKHFSLLIYDDVVTRESVTSPEMMLKTTDAWALSLNLAADGGAKRYIGTRYHLNDTWGVMLKRGSAVPRIHPATDNGEPDGKPVLMSVKALNDKHRDMGSYVFGCQMLQNPRSDMASGFNVDWLKFWRADNVTNLNIYILVDPANEKRRLNDYTSMFVVGLGPDNNYYVIDMIRDKLNLTERANKLMQLYDKYRPIGVGYEKYGLQADIQHIEFVQQLKNFRFEITPLGGPMPKNDRIRRLVPLFETGRIFFPYSLHYVTVTGKVEELIQAFIDDEYIQFPVSTHDDMLDCLARIEDPEFETDFPVFYNYQESDLLPEELPAY